MTITNNNHHVNQVKQSKDNALMNVANELQPLCEKFKCLCYGKGKFKNYQCKLKVDPTVRPVQQSLRRQPYQLRDKIKQKLHAMEQEGLIEKVDSPQEWLRNIVVTPKHNGDERICLDAREVNKAII